MEIADAVTVPTPCIKGAIGIIYISGREILYPVPNAISGKVVLDANGNGKADPGETGIAGIRVTDGISFATTDADGTKPAAVSYLINRLQPLPFATPVIVTLNPPREPDPSKLLRAFEYSHPLLDGRALRAQTAFAQLQGSRHTWFAGAWLGYGFHEDGIRSAHDVADGIRRQTASPSLPQRVAA